MNLDLTPRKARAIPSGMAYVQIGGRWWGVRASGWSLFALCQAALERFSRSAAGPPDDDAILHVEVEDQDYLVRVGRVRAWWAQRHPPPHQAWEPEPP